MIARFTDEPPGDDVGREFSRSHPRRAGSTADGVVIASCHVTKEPDQVFVQRDFGRRQEQAQSKQLPGSASGPCAPDAWDGPWRE